MAPLPVVHADAAWRAALRRCLDEGALASPRGRPTREVLHGPPLLSDLARPVVTTPARRLSYRLAAAEALWVLDGRDDLAALLPYAPGYARFSDDGRVLAGAYGPRVARQLGWVVDRLLADRWTRQAVVGVWSEQPAPSRDVPCTLSLVFSVRESPGGGQRLHLHAQMRSSDAWLGVPYDLFTFSLLAIRVACALNAARPGDPVSLGRLALSATSQHLYEEDEGRARECLASPLGPVRDLPPEGLVLSGAWEALRADVEAVRDGRDPVAWRWAPPHDRRLPGERGGAP